MQYTNSSARRRAVLLLACFTAIVGRVEGQVPMQPGDSLRIWAATYGLAGHTVRLQRVHSGQLELLLFETDTVLSIPFGSVSRLQRRGFGRRTLLGGLVGMGVGGLVGSLIPYRTCTEHHYFTGECTEYGNWKDPGIAGTIIGLAVGAGVGAYIGSRIRHRMWLRVALDDELSAGAPALALRIAVRVPSPL